MHLAVRGWYVVSKKRKEDSPRSRKERTRSRLTLTIRMSWAKGSSTRAFFKTGEGEKRDVGDASYKRGAPQQVEGEGVNEHIRYDLSGWEPRPKWVRVSTFKETV